MTGKYFLKCLECNSALGAKEKFIFSCKDHDALVRSVYSAKRFSPRNHPGLWRFYDWLPVEKTSDYDGKPITYKSEHLAKELGLKNLYISFNGYWPESGALLKTCTFKELETVLALQYAKERKVKGLVIASAGNTANAFAYMASKEALPVILVVPKKCICDLLVPEIDTSFVKTIVIEDGDYSDAISIAKKLPGITGFTYEGGARNIARRDGLGTVLLDAVERMRELPDHYFQAVGSGTGAIATWEAALRLREDGRFGRSLPKLQLSQNLPFVPMVRAWGEGRREIIPEKDMPQVRNILNLIYARVLSNRYPPYSVRGGVYDALKSTEGEMYGVTKGEAIEASNLFEALEGIDLLPAAAVATASLIKAVDMEEVSPRESILLNITGGGKKRLKEEISHQEIRVDMTISKGTSLDEMKEAIS